MILRRDAEDIGVSAAVPLAETTLEGSHLFEEIDARLAPRLGGGGERRVRVLGGARRRAPTLRRDLAQVPSARAEKRRVRGGDVQSGR